MDRRGQDSYGRGRGGSSGGRGLGRSGGGGGGYGGGGRNGGGGSGYGRGRCGGGGGYDQNYQSQYNESAGGRGGRGRGSHAGGYDDRATQQWSSHGGGAGGSVGRGVWNARPWGSSAPASSTGQPQPQPQPHHQSVPSAGAWNARPWGPSAPSSSTGQPQPHHQSLPSADFVEPNLQTLKISEQRQLVSSPEKMGNRRPLRRPGRGTLTVRSVRLLANHFPVKFNPNSTILHYDVDVKQVTTHDNQRSKRTIPKHLMRLIKDKLCSEKPNFPADMLAYDGEKNIFSAVELPDGEFTVKLSEGEGAVAQTYKLTIKEVNQLKLSKLKEYLAGSLSYVPRDILQGMELVMKENPSKYRIAVNRSFYSNDYNEKDDLKCGVAAYRGFQQSLRPTSQGLALCLDYSVLAFRKPMPVLDYLREYLDNFRGVNDVIRMRDEVTRAVKGLKVRVTHRITQQKYIISGLTKDSTRTLTFQLLDPDGQAPPRDVRIVDYFWEKYRKRIDYLDIPCLDVGKPGRQNCVPMEFCVLVEGQVYPKEELDRDRALFLKKISLAAPAERKNSICAMVQAEDGPCGIVAKNFGMEVEKNMTSLQGRVLGAPELKLRDSNGRVCPIRVDREKCHWNLVGKSVVEGQHVERWALIDFTSSRLPTQEFIMKLRGRAWNLGIKMEEPLGVRSTGMHEFSSPDRIEKLLRKVIAEAKQQLQIVVCVMARKDPGYKYLKWVSETQIGVVTQCCLSSNYSYQRGQDQYLANLCLKINAKVGGSNVELNERLPHFVHEDNVMFIGADVNHPAARNSTCPSIAAVVGTVNWPATNRYAARVQPQQHRKEKILNFGSICKDLLNTFTQLNNSRPKKIVVFRDGVSEGQFDMVLNEELTDLMEAIYEETYKPTITLVVAQKRHHTRMFIDEGYGGVGGNVPPGTVVDTTIVHPFEFDFYLCSHYGSLGTSKPTHYYVLYDDNGFTSDKLQKLIYDLCYTYARCTKPVSLVPPVYYADLVAYRGRLFQEVVMEQSPASSKMSSAASSSSSADSFDQNFYTLHPDLQNKMFFV